MTKKIVSLNEIKATNAVKEYREATNNKKLNDLLAENQIYINTVPNSVHPHDADMVKRLKEQAQKDYQQRMKNLEEFKIATKCAKCGDEFVYNMVKIPNYCSRCGNSFINSKVNKDD